ncbi:MAG: sulfatase-like hydrolase/transferase [Sorangiineae bacterium]|nr:sulfatase-like hydrolase/transferase [Polyangiaceae bacterium]MEB2321844.1 sulfatase-like hydrolase/transferase [Sorangiineae bacterium]
MGNARIDDEGPRAAPEPDSGIAALGARSAARARRSLRLRRAAAWALLCAPTAASIAIDFARRGERIELLTWRYRGYYALAALESLVVWGVLLYAASRRRGRMRWVAAALFLVGVTFTFGGQAYFFSQYNAYLNTDVSRFASNLMDSVVNQLFADFGTYLRANLLPLLGALAALVLGRKLIRSRRRSAIVAAAVVPLVAAASFALPTQHRQLQASTPDVLYLNAVGGLLATQLGWTDESHQLRPKVRQSLPVPKLTSKHTPRRNVLLVVLESVRADSTCIEYDPECERTGATNRLVPERFPFTRMRSMDSTTAISLSVLWSGTGADASREVMHTWPLIFDYARAAGYDTAYFTSQNLMFGNARLFVKNLGVGHFVSATELWPYSDLDMGAPEQLLASYVEEHFHELREPWLAVIHLSNCHYPYLVQDHYDTPFRPYTTSKAPEKNSEFKRYYQNAVWQQDQHVARMLRSVLDSDAGKRTVVVYTSDHGEAFREHGQMGHTFSVLAEETHVPAWIYGAPGTLSDDEQKHLRAKRDEFNFHVDVAPTILDLLGVLHDPAIAKYEAAMAGHSLLRPELTTAALPMTNCGGVWSCAFENWGYVKGPLKVEARAWDSTWHCYDDDADPLEQAPLEPMTDECQDLVALAIAKFGGLPGGKK